MRADVFTRRIMEMDYRVWLAMLITCCSMIALFGYKHINGRKDIPCAAAVITVDGKRVEGRAVCYLDRLTIFKIQTEGIAKIEWDFKDGTDEVNGQIAPHEFKKKGTYSIKVVVDNHCTYEREIVVKRQLQPGDGEKPIIRIFPNPTLPKVGSTVAFHVVSNIPASYYQWKLLNTDEVRHEDVAEFILNEPGKYTVQLIINNDPSTVTTKVIEVFALTAQVPETINSDGSGNGVSGRVAPPPALIDQFPFNSGGTIKESKNSATGVITDTSKAVPPKPGVIKIDQETFKSLLQDVVDDKKEIQELYEYLDYRETTRVKVNENETLITLKDFCKNMRNKKKNKRKIESLSFIPDDKNSIRDIRVKVSKSGGLLDRLNPFN